MEPYIDLLKKLFESSILIKYKDDFDEVGGVSPDILVSVMFYEFMDLPEECFGNQDCQNSEVPSIAYVCKQSKKQAKKIFREWANKELLYEIINCFERNFKVRNIEDKYITAFREVELLHLLKIQWLNVPKWKRLRMILDILKEFRKDHPNFYCRCNANINSTLRNDFTLKIIDAFNFKVTYPSLSRFTPYPLHYELIPVFNVLPIEITYIIISFLDYKNYLLLSLVSKEFHSLVNTQEVWKRLCISFTGREWKKPDMGWKLFFFTLKRSVPHYRNITDRIRDAFCCLRKLDYRSYTSTIPGKIYENIGYIFYQQSSEDVFDETGELKRPLCCNWEGDSELICKVLQSRGLNVRIPKSKTEHIIILPETNPLDLKKYFEFRIGYSVPQDNIHFVFSDDEEDDIEDNPPFEQKSKYE